MGDGNSDASTAESTCFKLSYENKGQAMALTENARMSELMDVKDMYTKQSNALL